MALRERCTLELSWEILLSNNFSPDPGDGEEEEASEDDELEEASEEDDIE